MTEPLSKTFWQFVRALFTENVGLKLVALTASVVLFTVVRGSEHGQRSLYVPVVAVLPDESSGKILVGDLPDKVRVTLSGSRSVLNAIQSVEPVQIDLSGGDRYYYFEPQQFDVPPGIDVEVTPASLSLDWEERLERVVPVRVQTHGSLAEGLSLAHAPGPRPGELLVSGPRSLVEGLRELPTETLELGSLVAGVRKHSLRIAPLPAQVRLVERNTVEVEATVQVRREQRVLRRLEVAALGTLAPVRIRPMHVDVVLAGPGNVLAALDSEHVVPVIELERNVLGASAVPVRVGIRKLPDGIEVARIEPPEVLVRAGR